LNQDDDEHGDIISEEMAKRRGMEYQVDARGHVCSARQPAPFIIDQLHARRLIDDSQHFFATQFLSMRLIFTDGLRHKGHRFYEAPDSEPRTIQPIAVDAWDYLYVCRAIKSRKYHAVLGDAIDEHSDIVTLNRLLSMPNLVDLAFTELARQISALWKAKKDCMEGGCQQCTGKCIRREDPPPYIRAVMAD
jgi:hypothetical protein